ncbi:MAG: Kdo hydroxylase family protein [Candidatus Paracaedibacteraceae bacterium]|nr:Kdo hydroxylase family protein [Candidatus Paracaedibacteraceae bacterium]
MHLYESYEDQWDLPIIEEKQQTLITALESGQVIFLPHLSFLLHEDEKQLLSSDCLKAGSKNISYNPLTQEVKGSFDPTIHLLQTMMGRFTSQSQQLIHNLFPHYQSTLQWGRTSYRPAEILGRQTSYRKDDTRLHVDAFPSSPTQGTRILRVFSNINPFDQPRVWHLGEPFQQVAEKFLPKIKAPIPTSRKILQLLGITKSYRTLYDHYMLHIHDTMKGDLDYQQNVQKMRVDFPPHSTWIVMTDQVSHAALSGQYLMEQTFNLPVDGMADESRSPLRALEALLNKPLI